MHTRPDTTVLTPLAPELWELRHALRISTGMWFDCRMCIVRLPDGSLLLHSPVPIDDVAAAHIATLGEVGHIVAPSCFHHLHLDAATARYPEARVWVAPGLKQKRVELAGRDSIPDRPEGAPTDWGGALQPLAISGAPMAGESVFLHAPSDSLIVTDLVFNMRHTRGWLTPWVMRGVGCHQKLAMSRSWRWLFVKDKAAACASARRLLAWDFGRIVPGHGEVFEGDARGVLAQQLSWLTASGTALLTAQRA